MSFLVSDVQHLLIFIIVLGACLVTGQLTAHLRYQGTVAAERHARSRSLFELTRESQRRFEKFALAGYESTIPGVGLGKAICRAIMQAHQSGNRTEAVPRGGACFVLALPLGHPPEVTEDDVVRA
jgi:K+-sensing histidine kinase KdpD